MKDLIIQKIEEVYNLAGEYAESDNEINILRGIMCTLVGAIADGSTLKLLERCSEHSQEQIDLYNQAKASLN